MFRVLNILLALLCLVEHAHSTGYDFGGDDPICWLTLIEAARQDSNNATIGEETISLGSAVQLNSCPPGTSIVFDSPRPQLEEGTKIDVTYSMTVFPGDLNATVGLASWMAPKGPTVLIPDLSDANVEVPHLNVHSCFSHMTGFCTPFVANGVLATHTSVLMSNWTETRDGDSMSCTVTTEDFSLAASQYTVIAHGRFYFRDSVGNVFKMDVATAWLGFVVDPMEIEIVLSVPVLTLTTTLSVLAMIFQFALLTVTTWFKDHKVMRLSQSPVLIGMMVCGLVASAMVPSILPVVGNDTCRLQLILVSVPLTFMIGLLVGKVLRVFKLTQGRSFKPKRIRTSFVYAVAATITMPQVIIQGLAILLGPSQKQRMESENQIEYQFVCESQRFEEFTTIGLIYGIMVLFSAVYAAHLSSKLGSAFNEARHIAVSIYAVSVLSIMSGAIEFAVQDDPSARLLVVGMSILISVCTIDGMIVIPKLLLIMRQSPKIQTADTNTEMPTRERESSVLDPSQVQDLVLFESVREGLLNEEAKDVICRIAQAATSVKGKFENMFNVKRGDVRDLINASLDLISLVSPDDDTTKSQTSMSKWARGSKIVV